MPVSLFVAGCLGLAFAAAPSHAANAASFAAPQQFQAGASPVDAVVADVDGDGIADIVTADAAGQHVVSIFVGPTPPSTTFGGDGFPLSGVPDDIAAGLFDANNRADLVSAVGGNLVVSISNGKDGFGFLGFTQRTPMSAGAGITLKFVKTGDFDGDGDVDIVATGNVDAGGGAIAVFLNDGAGNFGAPYVKTTSQPCGDFALADINRDGLRDVIATHFVFESVGIFVNDGAGGLGSEFNVDTWGRPTSVAMGDLTGDGVPDLVVGSIGMGGDFPPDEYIQLNVFQNLAAVNAASPSLSGDTIFVLYHSTTNDGSSGNADIAMIDASGDARSEVAVTSRYRGEVKIVSFDPVVDGQGVVTTWNGYNSTGFAANAQPWRVTAADVDGDGKADLVTANLGGNGINLLTNGGGSGGDTLAPTRHFSLNKPKGGKYVGGSPLTFRAEAGSTASDLAIRLQATTTPETASSWVDVPGAAFTFRTKPTPAWYVTTSELHGATWYFRTVSTAAGFDPAPNVDAPGTSPTAYLGPVTLLPGPAKPTVTATLRREGGAGAAHRGESVLGTFVVENEGDKPAENLYLVAYVPDGCTLTAAGGASTDFAIPGVAIWGPMTLNGHQSDAFQYHVKVGDGVVPGTTIQCRTAALGTLKVVKGKPKLKGVSVSSNELAIAAELGVTVLPYAATARAGDPLAMSFTITNDTNAAIDDVTFVEHLPRDVSFIEANYIDAQNHLVVAPLPTVNAARDAVTYSLGTLAPGASVKVFLNVRVRYDHGVSTKIALQSYTLSGTRTASSATVSGEPVPPAAEVTVDGPSAAGAPLIGFVAGLNTGHETYVSQRYGDVDFALPGEEVQYGYFFRNVGPVSAENAVLNVVVPPGTAILPGTAQLDAGNVTLTADASGVAHLPLGRLIANDPLIHVLLFSVRVLEPGETGAPKPGTLIITQNSSITTESLVASTYTEPAAVRLFVAQPAQLEIRDKKVSRSGFIAQGDEVECRYVIANAGMIGATDVTATFSVPSCEKVTSVLVGGAAVVPAFKKGVYSFDIGDLGAGATRTLEVTVELVKPAPVNITPSNTLHVQGVALVGPKSTGSGPSATDVEFTNYCDPNRACLFVALAGNSLGSKEIGVEYSILVGNTGGATAKKVVVTARAPEHMKDVSPGTKGNGKVDLKNHTVTWQIGDVPAHSVRAVHLSATPDDGFILGTSIVQQAGVTSSNAPSKVTGYVTSTIVATPTAATREAVVRQLHANGSTYKKGGNADVDAVLDLLDGDTVSVQLSGADLVALGNGANVVPLGGGKVFAWGPFSYISKTKDEQYLDRVQNGSFGFARLVDFFQGDPAELDVAGITCVNVTTVKAALDQLANMIPCKQASIVVAGAGNLVNASGNGFVAGSGVTGPALSQQAGSNVYGQPGGASLAGGLGNTVAAGRLLSENGLGLTASGTGRASFVAGGQIVATGGGNVISPNGGSLVSPNGGTLVSPNGGTLISPNGGTLISPNGGSLITNDGGSLITNDGGSLITNDGGSVISNDGASIVAQGGGN